jgi:EpsI family protein
MKIWLLYFLYLNHIASPLGGDWRKMTGTDIKHENSYLTETEIKYENTKVLVWHWYQLGTFETPNPYIAKLFDAYNLIINNRNDAAMITIATVIHSDKETSRKILGDFLNSSSSTINNLIKQN